MPMRCTARAGADLSATLFGEEMCSTDGGRLQAGEILCLEAGVCRYKSIRVESVQTRLRLCMLVDLFQHHIPRLSSCYGDCDI
jgi:hypothetical protein